MSPRLAERPASVSVDVAHPMGVTEIAEFLNLSRSRVHFLRGRDDFPAPRWNPSCGPLWDRSDIIEYSKKPRPAGRRPQAHPAA